MKCPKCVTKMLLYSFMDAEGFWEFKWCCTGCGNLETVQKPKCRH